MCPSTPPTTGWKKSDTMLHPDTRISQMHTNYKMPAHAIEYRLLLPDCASSTDAVLPATAP
jgi:hypothetical protein